MFNILGGNVYNCIWRNCSVFQNHGTINGKREINVSECPWVLFWYLESMILSRSFEVLFCIFFLFDVGRRRAEESVEGFITSSIKKSAIFVAFTSENV